MINKYKYIFLDRDGVINIERPDDYVKDVSEFIFEEKAIEAVAILSGKFERIFVVTNQRGVGRGVMTLADLELLHNYMVLKIEEAGGHIDKIYFCADVDAVSINRKPNVGMAFQACRDYPELIFTESIMVGNSRSDISFGNKLGMYTVLVGSKYPKGDKIYKEADVYYENLYKFVKTLG